MTMVDGATDMFLLHLVEADDFVLHVEHILQFVNQFIVVPRLGDEVGRSVLQPLYCQIDISVCSQQYDWRLRMLLTDGSKPEQTFVALVDTKRKVNVEQHSGDVLLTHQRQDL